MSKRLYENYEEFGYKTHESEMAKQQAYSCARNAAEIYRQLSNDVDLPEWIEYKISIANDYLVTANDYIKTGMETKQVPMNTVSEGKITLKSLLMEEEASIPESFSRPRLKYKLDDLKKFIDTETMEEHYKKHFKKYTDTLNEAIKEYNINLNFGTVEPIIGLLAVVNRYPDKVRNNAGGYYNHILYFENMMPNENPEPVGRIAELITEQFVDYKKFKETFKEAGLNVFGSGWVWLVLDNGELRILTTQNQDNPLMDPNFGGTILLAMDVWEHAYYLKHKSDRKSYIDDFFNVVCWNKVNERIKE